MQLHLKLSRLRPVRYEPFHSIKLRNASGLEATRIVKDESWIAPKYQLVLDVVHSSLRGRLAH